MKIKYFGPLFWHFFQSKIYTRKNTYARRLTVRAENCCRWCSTCTAAASSPAQRCTISRRSSWTTSPRAMWWPCSANIARDSLVRILLFFIIKWTNDEIGGQICRQKETPIVSHMNILVRVLSCWQLSLELDFHKLTLRWATVQLINSL